VNRITASELLDDGYRHIRTCSIVVRQQCCRTDAAVRIDGHAAAATAYFWNPLVLPRVDGTEQVWEFGGYYHHRLVRTLCAATCETDLGSERRQDTSAEDA
jgi:hypothetical protein